MTKKGYVRTEKDRARDRAWRNKNRKKLRTDQRRNYKAGHALVAKIKEREGCRFCDEQRPVCLVFHHLDPKQKTRAIAAMLYYTLPTILKEIGKCICVCQNCHAVIEAGELSTKGEPPVDIEKYATEI